MAEYTKQGRDELKTRAEALGIEVPSRMTKKEIYQAIMAHLRDEISKVEAEPVAFLSDDDITFTPMADAETIAAGGHLRALPAGDATDETMRAWREQDGVIEPVSTLPEMSRWEQMQAMARTLCRSALMPKHIRESHDAEADCMVILLTAHDLGLTATLALRKIAVIEGTPALHAELMRMLVQRDGHDFKIAVGRDDKGRARSATFTLHRREWEQGDWRETEFTIADAVDAELCKLTDDGEVRARASNGYRKPWERYTEDMLVARATSRACRRFCSDSLGGISYTPEELGAIDAEGEEVVPAAPVPLPIPAQPAVREALARRIAELEDDQIRAELKVAWKAAGLGTLADGEHVLLDDQVDRAEHLIAIAEHDDIEDAEVVDADVRDTADPTLLPCETDDEEIPDRVVDGVPDRGGPKTSRSSVSAHDPIDEATAKAYAREAREALDRAKETLPAGAAVCDICRKPLSEKNDGCASKAHAF